MEYSSGVGRVRGLLPHHWNPARRLRRHVPGYNVALRPNLLKPSKLVQPGILSKFDSRLSKYGYGGRCPRHEWTLLPNMLKPAELADRRILSNFGSFEQL